MSKSGIKGKPTHKEDNKSSPKVSKVAKNKESHKQLFEFQLDKPEIKNSNSDKANNEAVLSLKEDSKSNEDSKVSSLRAPPGLVKIKSIDKEIGKPKTENEESIITPSKKQQPSNELIDNEYKKVIDPAVSETKTLSRPASPALKQIKTDTSTFNDGKKEIQSTIMPQAQPFYPNNQNNVYANYAQPNFNLRPHQPNFSLHHLPFEFTSPVAMTPISPWFNQTGQFIQVPQGVLPAGLLSPIVANSPTVSSPGSAYPKRNIKSTESPSSDSKTSNKSNENDTKDSDTSSTNTTTKKKTHRDVDSTTSSTAKATIHENKETESKSNPDKNEGANKLNSEGRPNIYIRGLPSETTDESLRVLCEKYGTVHSVKAILEVLAVQLPGGEKKMVQGICKGFGFAMYNNKHDADVAIRELNSKGFDASYAKESFSSKLRSLHDSGSSNLYLSNIPFHYTEEMVAINMIIYQYGVTVISSRILRDPYGASRGVGFVRLATREEAELVIEHVNGLIVPGSGTTVPLQIRFADNQAQRNLRGSVKSTHDHKSGERSNKYSVSHELANQLNSVIINEFSQQVYNSNIYPQAMTQVPVISHVAPVPASSSNFKPILEERTASPPPKETRSNDHQKGNDSSKLAPQLAPPLVGRSRTTSNMVEDFKSEPAIKNSFSAHNFRKLD